MELLTSPSYEDLSKNAAQVVADLLHASKNKLLCIASGDTPSGMYRQLISMVQSNKLDLSDWFFVALDEWAGMDGSDEGSCRWHLDRQFFKPLRIEEQRICFFNGRAADLQQECTRTEIFIRDHGGIEAAVVGLGLNGHIGMNEPGTLPTTRVHVAEIDPETQQVGQKYFTKPTLLSHGITLGLANLLEARNVLLLASGAHKADIVKKIIEAPVSADIPATLLRSHPGLKIFLDAAAAKEIQA